MYNMHLYYKINYHLKDKLLILWEKKTNKNKKFHLKISFKKTIYHNQIHNLYSIPTSRFKYLLIWNNWLNLKRILFIFIHTEITHSKIQPKQTHVFRLKPHSEFKFTLHFAQKTASSRHGIDENMRELNA